MKRDASANGTQRSDRAHQETRNLTAGPTLISACLSILSILAPCVPAKMLAQQQPAAPEKPSSSPYSASPEYGSLLEELRHTAIHPSVLSAGKVQETPVALTSTEDETELVLDCASWRVTVGKAAWAMTIANKATGASWSMTKIEVNSSIPLLLGKVNKIERDRNRLTLQVAIADGTQTATVELAVLSPSTLRISLHAPRGDANARTTLTFKGAGPFFGLGERFSHARLDGLKVTTRPEDLLDPKATKREWTYAPTPFLLTLHGLGLYLDTSRTTTFDLTMAQQNSFSVQIDASEFDSYLFVGDGPKSILGAYTELTGRSPLPPPWALGLWICSYRGPDYVLGDARRLRREGVPASAIWSDDIMEKGTIEGWPLWQTGYYPDPPGFVRKLHELGFKALTYTYPFVRQTLAPYGLPNPTYVEGARTGLFVKNAAGNPTGPMFEPYMDANIDFTKPANVDWWDTEIRHILVEDNFDGWMEDFGEWIHDTDRFNNGLAGSDMATLYPLIYHKITRQIVERTKPDAVEFSRSGYAGSQGYSPVIWGGDQFASWSVVNGLAAVIPAGISAGLSGFSVWGPDIESHGSSKELWMRWVEFGALTPVMRDHLWHRPDLAVNQWSDPQNMDFFRKYAKLHTTLFPYLYSYAAEASKTGLPIMRHLMLAWPSDPMTYDADQEYLLGDEMLVAPVVEEGATTRALYLPNGSWVDFWTGSVMEGKRMVTVRAPLDRIPILVQAGAIIPLIASETETLAQDLAGDRYQTLDDRLILKVFPAVATTKKSFKLYDATLTEADQEKGRIQVRVTASPVVRRYEIVLPGSSKPQSILVGNELLREGRKPGPSEWSPQWWSDATDGTVHVRFTKKDFELIVNRR